MIAADILVLAVPMYNFGLPSSLKAWIDHVVRAGRTFSYTKDGPHGLLQGKRAILVLASGGVYSEGPAKAFDFQEGYLRSILAFIGIANIDVIRVEGVALGDVATRAALDGARARSREIVRVAA